MFVDKDDLSAILDHAMTSKAKQGKDSLMRIAFEEAVQISHHVGAVFHLGFNQGQGLIRTEFKSGDQFLEVAVVSVYAR